ncbi:lectin [Luteimonas lutimaris]|uniref:Lectin n=1 Tax=Luteimonas lutimaris TaxID=698645 RepID=A0ABP7MX30_9GAMM
MKHTIPAVALLALALAACTAERTPDDSAATPADTADAMAGDPAAPPPLDQPADDVPPATAPINQAPDLGQVRMDGYGDMRFGMTAEEATQAWGGELETAGDAADACYYLVPKWVTVPSDFAFMIEGGKFVRYDVGTGREIAPGGGKVGMDAGEIRDLYAGRVEETPHKYVEGGLYLRVDDANGGDGKLVFATGKDGKVTSWRVGLPPQVDYVEGCS